MNEIGKVVGIGISALLLIILLAMFNVFLWGVVFWFIGIFIGNLILGLLASFGIVGYSMFQIGLIVGIISLILGTIFGKRGINEYL